MNRCGFCFSEQSDVCKKLAGDRCPHPGREALQNAAAIADQVSPRPAPLPTDSAERKDTPIWSGVLRYFPKALADVARLSKIGNDKHNPGEPLHWARGKSDDHGDCIVRHQIEAGAIDTDTVLHDAKVAWRALAQLEIAIEKLRAEGVVYPPQLKDSEHD